MIVRLGDVTVGRRTAVHLSAIDGEAIWSSRLITIAIICINQAAVIRLAIKSALRQDFDHYGVLIVDVASTDRPASTIREYADRATVFIRDQNGGEMTARNNAMAAVRGEYVSFLVSDDAWFRRTLSPFAEAVRCRNSPSLVVGKLFKFLQTTELTHIGRDIYRDSLTS